jgi:CBS domain containing-hemolysin-like protein
MLPLWVLIGLVLLLILLQGFFSGSETVYTSTSKAFIHDLAQRGDPRAGEIRTMLSRTERFLGTTLTGTNLAMVASTSLCQVIVRRYIEPSAAFQAFVIAVPAPWDWGTVSNALIMIPSILVLAELVPKSLARAHADALALPLVRPLRLAQTILAPISFLVARMAATLAGWAGGPMQNAFKPAVTREDLKAMAVMAAEQEVVPDLVGSILLTVFELDRKPVSSMMVPLVDVASVPEEATVGDVERLSVATGHAQFPVFSARVDEIVGVVSLRHLLYAASAHGGDLPAHTAIGPYIRRQVMFVPETKSVTSLLHELRYQHIPMAVVVDEYGGVVGILTLEDLVEELVGELHDERDRPAAALAILEGGAFECDGKMSIAALGEALGCTVNRDGFDTVAGLVLKLAGRIPAAGERFRFGDYEIEVVRVVKHKVARLRLRQLVAGKLEGEAPRARTRR